MYHPYSLCCWLTITSCITLSSMLYRSKKILLIRALNCVNQSGGQGEQECQTEITGPARGIWERNEPRRRLTSLCKAEHQDVRSVLAARWVFPVRYQSFGELASLFSSLALAVLCTCRRWVRWLLLPSELCGHRDAQPVSLPTPHVVCPPHLHAVVAKPCVRLQVGHKLGLVTQLEW